MAIWQTLYPDLLTVCSSALRVRSVPLRNPAGVIIGYRHVLERDHAHQRRAAVLLARELTERLSFIDDDCEGPSHFAYATLANADSCGGGPALAELFLHYGTWFRSPAERSNYPGTSHQRPQPAGYYTMSVLPDAEALMVSVYAQEAASSELDASLGASCSAAFSAARESHLEQLTLFKAPRGFA